MLQYSACGTSQIQVNPTQVREEMGHPVLSFLRFFNNTVALVLGCQNNTNKVATASRPSPLGASPLLFTTKDSTECHSVECFY